MIYESENRDLYRLYPGGMEGTRGGPRGSTGGLPAARELRAGLGKPHQVTVSSGSDHFQFVASIAWVGVGWRQCKDISLPLVAPRNRKNIDFIATS